MTATEAFRRRDVLLQYLAETAPVHDRSEIARLTTQVLQAAVRHLDAIATGNQYYQDLSAVAAMAFLLLNKHSDRRCDLTWSRADKKLWRILLRATELLFGAIPPEQLALRGKELVARWIVQFFDVKLSTLQKLAAEHDFIAQQLAGRISELEAELAAIEARRAANAV